jgi:hypothetical protein
MSLTDKIQSWRANRAWRVWAKTAPGEGEVLVILQHQDGVLEKCPATYDADTERYMARRSDGELIPIVANQDTDISRLDGVPVMFAYHGLAFPISNFATAELSRRTYEKWQNDDLFLHKDDLEKLQYSIGELDEDDIDILETDEDGDLYFDIKGNKVSNVSDITDEERKAQENDGYIPTFYFDEENFVRDSDRDRVLKMTEIPMPETHSVDLRAIGHTSASDEDAPSDMGRVGGGAVVCQTHPDEQGGSSLAKIGWLGLGAMLAWVSTVLANSSGGSGGGGGGGGSDGPVPGGTPNPLPESITVPEGVIEGFAPTVLDYGSEVTEFATTVAGVIT